MPALHFLALCSAEAADGKRFLFKGSTTVAPFVRDAVGEYSRVSDVRVVVEPVPTAEGLKCVRDGKCDVGMIS
ncbi:hypothetical protein EBZ37_10715, partial [bacterium]|nr:hypothetical protein [bacterium]